MKKKKYTFKNKEIPRWLFFIAAIFSLLYISWWLQFSNIGNIYLYILLLVGEVFYLYMTFGYWFTVWNTKAQIPPVKKYFPTIDIYIPVCGEPLAIIEKTVKAVYAMKYKDSCIRNFPDAVHVYILNDGYIARKANWRDPEEVKKTYPVEIITRRVVGGAKAGNINNALEKTKGEYIVIFDADMAPLPDFLIKTLGYFQDKTLGFIQTPQFYSNYSENMVTAGAWAQQEIFFGAICKGKNNLNSAFCCGTNVIFRKDVLKQVGGFDTENIAEDFATSINIHAKGWKSIYLDEVLAEGLAPKNLEEYYGQQFRWAKGSIDVFFKNNPIVKKGLNWKQKMQYCLSLSYYFMGVFIMIDALIPVFYLFTHIVPVKGSPYLYIILFFPYILFIVYILSRSTNGKLSFKALQFSIGLFYIHIRAIIASIFHHKNTFRVTNKHDQKNHVYVHLVIPHIIYMIIGITAILFSIHVYGVTPALMTNSSWILFTIVLLSGHVHASVGSFKLMPFKGVQHIKNSQIQIHINAQ